MVQTRKLIRKKANRPVAKVTQPGLEEPFTLAELIAGALASQAASLSTPPDIFSARLELSNGELVRDFDVDLRGSGLVIKLFEAPPAAWNPTETKAATPETPRKGALALNSRCGSSFQTTGTKKRTW